jgi:hypothetical protein
MRQFFFFMDELLLPVDVKGTSSKHQAFDSGLYIVRW